MKNLKFGQVARFLSQNNGNATVETADVKGTTQFKINGVAVLSVPTATGMVNEMTVRGALRTASTDKNVRNRPGAAIAATA